MRFKISTLALAVTVAMLSACSKEPEPAVEKTKISDSAKQSPFQRNGELLTVNVDAMPRADFVRKMAELTGVKITSEGDNSQPVTVHAVDATLRKVLSMAVADAPYAVTMQYTNLQDSFPATVTITRYKGVAAAPSTQAIQLAADTQPSRFTSVSEAPVVAPAQGVEDEPDIMAMKPDEQISYFLGQPEEEQVSIVFSMEPTSEEAELMAALMAKPEVSSEVKIEILDSLSGTEYALASPAIKLALDSDDPEIATKAAETLGGMGSAKDIPALKALGEKTDNEDVRTAVNDAVEALQP